MAHYRSPSPSHGRLHGISNSRTPEAAAFDRRLHGANPVVVSPSLNKNHPLRSSFELMKENDREAIYAGEVVTARPKSSPSASAAALAASKNGKNFMSPTISASSKAVGPSPRRKILGERNQDLSNVRSSIESIGSLARSSVESLPTLAAPVMPSVKPAALALQGGAQKASSGRQDEAMMNHAFVSVGVDHRPLDDLPAAADDPHTPAPAIAPLDADPTLPPYDPETNFLSPRPRFLFYRPKPPQEMTELDLEDDRLLDDAPSEKSGEEDSDGQEKTETRKSLDLSDSVEEENEESGVENPVEAIVAPEEPEADLNNKPDEEAEEVQKEQQQEEDEAVHAVDPVDDSASSPMVSVNDTADVNESLFPELKEPRSVAAPPPPKPRSSMSKVPLFMIAALLLACCAVPIMDTTVAPASFPSLGPFHSPALKVIDDLHLRDHWRRAAEFADTNLRELASILHHYAHLPRLASSTTKEEKDDGWLLPSNFTAALFHDEEDLDFLLGQTARESIMDAVNGAFGVEESEEGAEEEFAALGEDLKEKNRLPSLTLEQDGLNQEVPAVVAVFQEEVTLSEDSIESQGQVVDYDMSLEVKEDAGGEVTTETDLPSPSHGDQSSGAEFSEADAEPHPDQSSESRSSEQVLDADDSSLGVTDGVEDPSLSEIAADVVSSLTEEGNKTVLAVSSFLIAVVAVLVSLYYVKQKRHSPAAAPLAAPQATPAALPAASLQEASRTADQSPLPEHLLGRTLHPHSELAEDRSKVVAATTPLAVSKEGAVKEEEEVEENARIQDARARRDSTASSTTSFGSFTTLEKVSAKKGRSSKDKDEPMTPVRRSSRIRSHK